MGIVEFAVFLFRIFQTKHKFRGITLPFGYGYDFVQFLCQCGDQIFGFCFNLIEHRFTFFEIIGNRRRRVRIFLDFLQESLILFFQSVHFFKRYGDQIGYGSAFGHKLIYFGYPRIVRDGEFFQFRFGGNERRIEQSFGPLFIFIVTHLSLQRFVESIKRISRLADSRCLRKCDFFHRTDLYDQVFHVVLRIVLSGRKIVCILLGIIFTEIRLFIFRQSGIFIYNGRDRLIEIQQILFKRFVQRNFRGGKISHFARQSGNFIQ